MDHGAAFLPSSLHTPFERLETERPLPHLSFAAGHSPLLLQSSRLPTSLAHRPVSIYLQPSSQLFPFSSAGTSSPMLRVTTPAHNSGYLLHLSPAATAASQSNRPHFPLCHRPVPSAHSCWPLHLPTASRPLHFICHWPVHHRPPHHWPPPFATSQSAITPHTLNQRPPLHSPLPSGYFHSSHASSHFTSPSTQRSANLHFTSSSLLLVFT
ncbi:hypothetical protein MRB53_030080 [Persea americana]|uniref:Uncharacterized protein n=1 Tax=Persea americana TaxID=3435 RepID=A0ACC2KK64_PERAE|nr:hypothetical protein MRB53_030080 [Persea americana]